MFVLLINSLIILVSSFVQGVTGFAFALIAIPLLSVSILPVELVPTCVLLSLIINIIMYAKRRTKLGIMDIKLLILFGIIGTYPGIWLLNFFSGDIIKFSAGIVILFTSLSLFLGKSIKFKNESTGMSITGLISGILNGSTSMSGPPIILYLANNNSHKEEIRSAMPSFGIITNVLAIIIYGFNGNLTGPVLHHFIISAPVLVAGVYAGIYFSKFINEKTFRSIVLSLLLITGFLAMLTSILNQIKH